MGRRINIIDWEEMFPKQTSPDREALEHESFLPRRSFKRRKEQLQIPSSVYSRKAEDSECRCGKNQKNRSASPGYGFYEIYLKLKREEIDRFAAIEKKKLEDPYSINKCITVLEGLKGLQMGDILVAADIFKTKENREIFLSFSSDALRLAWITREIGRA